MAERTFTWGGLKSLAKDYIKKHGNVGFSTEKAHYKITGELARGGMGVTFLAEKYTDGKTSYPPEKVVLKVPLPQSLDEYVKEDFVREAERMTFIEAENVVKMNGIGRLPAKLLGLQKPSKLPFIELEYIGGGSLDQLIAIHKKLGLEIPPELVAYIMLGVAKGCDQAYMSGDSIWYHYNVVHQDLDPGNILISENGTVKIIDFGIAVHDPCYFDLEDTQELEDPKTRENQPSYYKQGGFKGKISYAAPRQLWMSRYVMEAMREGIELDWAEKHIITRITPETDIYTIGLIGYELTTLENPFRMRPKRNRMGGIDFIGTLQEAEILRHRFQICCLGRHTPLWVRGHLGGIARLIDDCMFGLGYGEKYCTYDELVSELKKMLSFTEKINCEPITDKSLRDYMQLIDEFHAVVESKVALWKKLHPNAPEKQLRQAREQITDHYLKDEKRFKPYERSLEFILKARKEPIKADFLARSDGLAPIRVMYHAEMPEKYKPKVKNQLLRRPALSLADKASDEELRSILRTNYASWRAEKMLFTHEFSGSKQTKDCDVQIRFSGDEEDIMRSATAKRKIIRLSVKQKDFGFEWTARYDGSVTYHTQNNHRSRRHLINECSDQTVNFQPKPSVNECFEYIDGSLDLR